MFYQLMVKRKGQVIYLNLNETYTLGKHLSLINFSFCISSRLTCQSSSVDYSQSSSVDYSIFNHTHAYKKAYMHHLSDIIYWLIMRNKLLNHWGTNFLHELPRGWSQNCLAILVSANNPLNNYLANIDRMWGEHLVFH